MKWNQIIFFILKEYKKFIIIVLVGVIILAGVSYGIIKIFYNTGISQKQAFQKKAIKEFQEIKNQNEKPFN